MKRKRQVAPFESRVRLVLLGILLASLLLQGGTSFVMDRAREAMEAELIRPLEAALDHMEIRGAREPIPFQGLLRTRVHLQRQERFFLADTLAPTVRAAWLRYPRRVQARMLAGETVQLTRTAQDLLYFQLARVVKGPRAQLISVQRSFPGYGRLRELDRWNTGTRVIGLSLLLVAVFLVTRELTRPFRQLRRVAAAAQQKLNWERPPSHEEWENVIETFSATIERLKADEAKLQERYVTSEDARQRLDHVNQMIIDAIPSSIIATDEDGRIVRSNPAAERLPGLPVPEAGQYLHDYVASWPELSQSLKDRRNLSHEFDFTHNGERFHFRWQRIPVLDGGSLLLLDDLTRVRRLEALLAQRARLAALGETAAGLAHELRNAMGAILGYAKLIARSGDDPAREMAARVENEAGAMEEMLNRFLEVARPTDTRPVPLRVAEFVREEAARYEERMRKAGIELSLSLDEKMECTFDPLWMRQAFGNLLENALQIVPQGGHVHVTAARFSDGWRLCVADSGPGVPPEWREKILSPFVSMRAGGTGLGLALVQKVVTGHGGRVEVGEAALGGAEFSLIFPSKYTRGYLPPQPAVTNSTAAG